LTPADTVCVTIAANIAESALLSYAACFPDSVVGLISDRGIAIPEYVELFVRTARDDLAAFAPATAQANINLAILATVAVPLPSVDEQIEIVRRATAALASADRLASQTEHVQTTLDDILRAMHAKAFRGELAPIETR
jgi:type I restriction enzyme S subunit